MFVDMCQSQNACKMDLSQGSSVKVKLLTFSRQQWFSTGDDLLISKQHLGTFLVVITGGKLLTSNILQWTRQLPKTKTLPKNLSIAMVEKLL